MLQAGTLRATAKLLELVDSSSAKVSLDASKLVLGLEGITPVERTHVRLDANVQVAGYVVDLSDDDMTPAPIVGAAEASPDRQPGRRRELEAEPVVQQLEPTRPDDASDRER
jgi:hypothetical protein